MKGQLLFTRRIDTYVASAIIIRMQVDEALAAFSLYLLEEQKVRVFYLCFSGRTMYYILNQNNEFVLWHKAMTALC